MKDLETVKEILSKFYDLNLNPTYLFGSRVTGTNREDSDLDILIDDKTITPETLSFINEAFEESSLLYKVDIVLRNRIDDEFFQKISSSLKKI